MARAALPRYETQVVTFSEWMTVEEAAQALSRTPARIRQMIGDGNFQTVAHVGERPVYLLSREEIKEMRPASE